MATFIRPIAGNNVPISDDFSEHVARGSVNPGCDYAVARGTRVRLAGAGTIKVRDDNTGGAAGRSLVVYYDAGGSGDYLHLSDIADNIVLNGHYAQGTDVGATGGSANGSESGVGNHLHYTHRTGQTTGYSNVGNVDPETVYGPESLSPTQRQVRPQGPEVLRRSTPDTSLPDLEPDLQPGEVGNFKGWIHGEHVTTSYANTDIWYQGISDNWFWAGGFTEVSGHDLTDLNPVAPPVAGERVVLDSASANVRSASNTTAAIVGSYPAGSKQVFKYWQKGQTVSQNGVSTDIWYVTADEKQFAWAGAFKSIDKTGLTELTGAIPPTPVDPDNPAGLPEYTPVWDKAVKGLKAPLGYKNGVPVSRTTKGDPPVATDGVIRFLGLHHTATTSDCLQYFSTANDRGSCPSYYFRPDGETIELIRPSGKPASAGAEWNYRSIMVEMLNSTGEPTWELTAIQRTRAAELAVRMQEASLLEDGTWDGVPIAFTINAESILGHNQMTGGTTCPGPDMHVEAIVQEALALWDLKHPVDPEPVPDYKEQLDRIEKKLDSLRDHLGDKALL